MPTIRPRSGADEDTVLAQASQEIGLNAERCRILSFFAAHLGPEWIATADSSQIVDRARTEISDPLRSGQQFIGLLNIATVGILARKEILDGAGDLTPRGVEALRIVASYYETDPG